MTDFISLGDAASAVVKEATIKRGKDMKTSETIGKISEALAKAQAIITNPTKDAVNPHFRNRYASLDTGLNIVRSALSANNICFTQGTRLDGDLLVLETLLAHSSGEWMQSEYPVARFPVKQQELGSAMTYAKRYSLFALVGIAGEDDDDGNESKQSIQSSNARKPMNGQNNGRSLPEPEPQRDETMLDAIMSSLKSAEALPEWKKENDARIANLTDQEKEILRVAYSTRLHELKGAA